MARTEAWRVSDEFWEKVQLLIPPTPSHAKGGRTRMDDRQAFAAMIYVLRTGIQWNALPRQMGASSTVHDRYQEWERLGFFEQLWRAGLLEYEELEGIEWEWQAIDGAMTKAPLGRGASGKNPTDRAKMGTKRSMLTDGAGIPLAVAVEGANRHDLRLLVATLEGLVVARYLGGNPNGSMRDIAGIANDRGNVVGLMPHPEHAVEDLTGPSTDGLGFFTSVLKAAVNA